MNELIVLNEQSVCDCVSLAFNFAQPIAMQ